MIQLANAVLVPLGLRLESRTLERREQDRILRAVTRGDFHAPVYPVPRCFESQRFKEILSALPKYADRLATFHEKSRNDLGFEYGNGFFSSPDAEVLYTLVGEVRPPRIVEIGCGNRTRIIHQAVVDGGIDCFHRCIDPQPRRDISGFADEITVAPIETQSPHELTTLLGPGDILFIDTSHELAPANDVAFIYGRLLPLVRPGVIIHIHDIFLPYEYPVEWVRDLHLNWTEQYVVQVMLMDSESWDVLWPGHYLQRTLQHFGEHFPNNEGRLAQSLWITKKKDTQLR